MEVSFIAMIGIVKKSAIMMIDIAIGARRDEGSQWGWHSGPACRGEGKDTITAGGEGAAGDGRRTIYSHDTTSTI